MRYRCLPILLCLASTAAAQEQAATRRTPRIISVSDLLFRSSPPMAPRLAVLTRRKNSEDEVSPSLLTQRPFLSMEKDQLIELIRETGGDAAEKTSIVYRGSSLLVSGPAEPVAKIEQTIAALRRAVTKRLKVHARLYEIDASSPYPATATAAELATLTEKLPLLWSGQATARTGQQVALGQTKYSRYVADVDVEVAEEASIGKPVTDSLFEGIRLVVECHALIGSTDRAFKCQFAIAEQEQPIRMQPTGVQGLPAIGVPALRATSGTFSGRVGHDGALLLSVQGRQGTGSNVLLVVQAAASGDPTPSEVSVGRTLLLPVSALTTPSLKHEPPFTQSEDDPEASRGGYPSLFVEEQEQNDRGDLLLTVLRQELGRMLEQEDDGAVDLTSNGLGHGFILVRGSEQTRAEARRRLTELQDRWIRAVECQAITELHAVQRSSGTFARVDRSAGASASDTMHRVTFPCLIGDCGLLFRGIESSVVRDAAVEVANKTSLTNPVVQTTFSGISVCVIPELQGKRVGAELRVAINYIPAPERQPTAQGKGCDLYHVQVHKAEFRSDGPVTLDRATPLGWGPRLAGRKTDLRMHQIVRFRKIW